ncbi:hypothetical protein Landi51_01723 [Colletotrichum acutatum]
MSAALPPQTQTNVTISPQKPAIEPSPRGETHTEYCVHSLDRFHIETCAAGTLVKDPLSRATSAVVVAAAAAAAATAPLPIVASGGGPWCRAVRRCTFSSAVLAKRFSELAWDALPWPFSPGAIALLALRRPVDDFNAIHCTPEPQPRGLALLAWSAAPPAVLGA